MEIINTTLPNGTKSFRIVPSLGMVLMRKSDGAIAEEGLTLGYIYYLNGEKLAEPHLEIPDDYTEVLKPTEEEEVDYEGLELLERAKEEKIKAITIYDKSQSVNAFYVGDMVAWLDRETRLSLMNSTNIQKSVGMEETTLWLENQSYTLPCDMVIGMLTQLELYALECYNVTASHKANVLGLEDVESVNGYDFTTGYPDKLRFEV